MFTSGGLTEAIEEGQLLLVDGHPHFPTGNRPASGQAAANHSGKRKECSAEASRSPPLTGVTSRVVSDPFPGARHAPRVIQECGWSYLLAEAGVTWVADTAYTATTAVTPVKKKPSQPRAEWEKQFNKTIAGLRANVEHCITHLKSWKILVKGYRGRLNELPAIIRIVTQLGLLRTQ